MTHRKRVATAFFLSMIVGLVFGVFVSNAQTYERTIGDHTWALVVEGDGVTYTTPTQTTWVSRDVLQTIPRDTDDYRWTANDLTMVVDFVEADYFYPFRTANEDSLDLLIDDLIDALTFERGRNAAFVDEIADLQEQVTQQELAASAAIIARDAAIVERDAAYAAVAPLEEENHRLQSELAEREIRDVARMQRILRALEQ